MISYNEDNFLFSRLYLFDQIYMKRRGSINIIHRFRARKAKKICTSYIDSIDSIREINFILICDFMQFINNCKDFFPYPGFEYLDLKSEDVLRIKFNKDIYDTKEKDTAIISNGESYYIPSILEGEELMIIYNRRLDTIRVNTPSKDKVIFNRVYKSLSLAPDTIENSYIFNNVKSIMRICAKAYVKGDADIVTRLFRTEPMD